MKDVGDLEEKEVAEEGRGHGIQSTVQGAPPTAEGAR